MTTAIDPRTDRPYGDHGTANEAIDYAIERAGIEAGEFLVAWREGTLEEWDDFYAYIDDPVVVRPERRLWKGIALGVVISYLAFGMLFASAMSRSIPAMNAAGAAYYALVWPGFFASGGFGTPVPPIFPWMFTFEAGA